VTAVPRTSRAPRPPPTPAHQFPLITQPPDRSPSARPGRHCAKKQHEQPLVGDGQHTSAADARGGRSCVGHGLPAGGHSIGTLQSRHVRTRRFPDTRRSVEADGSIPAGYTSRRSSWTAVALGRQPRIRSFAMPSNQGANPACRLSGWKGLHEHHHTPTRGDPTSRSGPSREHQMATQAGTRDGGESAPGDDPVVQILCTRSPTDRIVGRKCPKLTYRINARESKNPGHTACARVIRFVRRQGLEPRTR
jgi:hypothetical protein